MGATNGKNGKANGATSGARSSGSATAGAPKPEGKGKSRPKKKPAVAVRHAFVTGYPGFIGVKLADRILEERPKARLTLLVQEKHKKSAEQFLKRHPEAQRKRVRLLIGDVAQMDLGLSGPEIEELTETVTHVFHLAAIQHLGQPDSEVERVNVGGTRNLLALCREMPKLKRLAHFSTCYVSGDRIGVITEDELDEGQTFRNAYERTKFRAEKLVRSQMGSLPVTIIRPSIVVGHSETGEIDRFGGIYTMGMLIVTSPIGVPIPLPGDGVAPLNVVPVDFVTRAALHLVTDRDTVGLTFHLVDPNPLSARHVYELIAKRAGKRLPRVKLSYGVAKRLLRMPVIERFSRKQAQALDYLNHLAIYNCANTLTHLEGTGILCPRIDTYVDRLMDFVREHVKKTKRTKGTSPGPSRLLRARSDPYVR